MHLIWILCCYCVTQLAVNRLIEINVRLVYNIKLNLKFELFDIKFTIKIYYSAKPHENALASNPGPMFILSYSSSRQYFSWCDRKTRFFYGLLCYWSITHNRSYHYYKKEKTTFAEY